MPTLKRSRGGQVEPDGFDGLGLKTMISGWFSNFVCKIGDGLGAIKVRAESTWRHRETCVEAKQSREGGVSVRCSQKKMDHFISAWTYIVVNSLGHFSRSSETLYR